MYRGNPMFRFSNTLPRHAVAVALLAAAGFFCATQAVAEQTNASPEAKAKTKKASDVIPEVVVTARKRSENLQTVPLAVSVVNSHIMKQQNRNNVIDLIPILPSVGLRAQPENKDTDILIRGLGTITTSAAAEPDVSTVIDGVVLARPGQMVSNLMDVNRVEVLRGPQGTLFGKNASAGVINIITNNPSQTPSGSVDVGAYEGNEIRTAAVANGGINDQLSARLAVEDNSYEGNSENIFLHSKTNGSTSHGFRLKVLYTPTDNLSVLWSVDQLQSTGTGQTGIFLATYNTAYPSGQKIYNTKLPAVLAAEGITPSFHNTQISTNSPSYMTDLSTGTSLTINYHFNGYTLTSITAYRYWKNMQTGDLDGFSSPNAVMPIEIVDLGHAQVSQTSEELRLSSPVGGFVNYVVGAYYFRAPDYEDYQRTTTIPNSSGNIVFDGINRYGSHPTNYSLFGEADFNFTDRFRGLFGLRVVHDDLGFYSNRVSSSPNPAPGIQPSFAATGSTHKSDYAGRIGVQYDLGDTTHTYLTYSRGYKGPAYNVFFNMNPLETNVLMPEISKDIELGSKSTFFDRRFLFNVALYHDKVSNYQANEPDIVAGAVVTRLINAGTVSTRGVEIDAIVRPTDALTLTANYAYTDARIDNFNCPAGAGTACEVNGKPLPFAPKNKFSGRADYVMPVTSDMDASFDVEYTYQSSQQSSIRETQATILPGYGIWNAGVTLNNSENGWSVRLLVRNIANKHYYTDRIEAFGGLIGQMPRDFNRYFGVNIHKDF